MEYTKAVNPTSAVQYSNFESASSIKKEQLTVATNKVRRNYSYSSSIIKTPLLGNNNTYAFANISDNKQSATKNTNLNEFMMSRERTVKRDVSYRSSFRRKHTTATDYLQNRELNMAQPTAANNNTRFSFYGHSNGINRKPTLDPYRTKNSYNVSPTLQSVAEFSNGSVTDGNYVHSGSSHTNSFAVRKQPQLGSDEHLDLNKKLSLSSLATGTSSIAQVSIFRTTDNNRENPARWNNKPLPPGGLNIKKVRQNSNTDRVVSNRRVLSVSRVRKSSNTSNKPQNIIKRFEIFMHKLGTFSRRQVIKFKLMFQKMIRHDFNPQDEAFKKLSRTASSLLSNSKKRVSSSRVLSRRITSSLHSGMDLNGAFYNNIMKNQNLSRNSSIKRNLSIKLQTLIDDREKTLNMKLHQSEKKLPPPPVPTKGLSVRRSPSSMKRAVSVITTNTLKKEQEALTPTLGQGLNKERFGTVKVNRLGLETLDEKEITEEDMTIRNSSIVNRSMRSDLRDVSNGTSVYEDNADKFSMLSSQFKHGKLSHNGISHKPSNIRVISGGFDDYDVSSMDYSFKSAHEDILLDITEDMSGEEDEENEENLEALLNQFIKEIIVKRVNNNLQLAALKKIKELQRPSVRYDHKKTSSINDTNVNNTKLNIPRSLSLPVVRISYN